MTRSRVHRPPSSAREEGRRRAPFRTTPLRRAAGEERASDGTVGRILARCWWWRPREAMPSMAWEREGWRRRLAGKVGPTKQWRIPKLHVWFHRRRLQQKALLSIIQQGWHPPMISWKEHPRTEARRMAGKEGAFERRIWRTHGRCRRHHWTVREANPLQKALLPRQQQQQWLPMLPWKWPPQGKAWRMTWKEGSITNQIWRKCHHRYWTVREAVPLQKGSPPRLAGKGGRTNRRVRRIHSRCQQQHLTKRDVRPLQKGRELLPKTQRWRPMLPQRKNPQAEAS